MGRHRKPRRLSRWSGRRPRHAPYPFARRVVLLSACLLIPGTGGAAVLASTHLDHPPAASAGHRPDAVRRTGGQAAAPVKRPSTGTGSPAARPPKPSATVSAATPSAPATPPVPFSPYADVLAWPALDLAKTAERTGVKDYTLGFVSVDTGCTAAWGGMSALDDASVRRLIKQVPGRVTVSFGGPHGTEPAERCDGAAALAAQYRAVLDATHAERLDFYLTDEALADGAAAQLRTQALALLQHDRHGPQVSITVPVRRSGLSADALGALRTAAAGGVDVATVNLVPAAGGGAQALIASATVAHGQLQRLYRLDAAATWRRMAVTPVIGVTGAHTGFQPDDARQVRAWAGAHALGGLSMWSISRDTPCVTGGTAKADACSGLDEDAGVFTATLSGS